MWSYFLNVVYIFEKFIGNYFFASDELGNNVNQEIVDRWPQFKSVFEMQNEEEPAPKTDNISGTTFTTDDLIWNWFKNNFFLFITQEPEKTATKKRRFYLVSNTIHLDDIIR